MVVITVNYYLSIHQLFQNEKKLRAVSLMKFSGMSPKEIQANPERGLEQYSGAEATAQHIFGLLSEQMALQPPNVSQADANALVYVVGALVRSTLKRYNFCPSCTQILVDKKLDNQEAIVLTEEQGPNCQIADSLLEFLNFVNRGGLIVPSEIAFALGVKCYNIFASLTTNNVTECLFLNGGQQKCVFLHLVFLFVNSESEIMEISSSTFKCDNEHFYYQDLILRFCNLFSKNYIQKFNVASEKSLSDSQKIHKLQSSSRK